MGRDKALIEIGGTTVIERILEVLGTVTSEIVIIGDRPEYRAFGCPVVPDAVPECGPIGGLLTALMHSKHEHAFVTACDLPLLQADLVAAMASIDREYDALVPVRNVKGQQRFEPLHAIYSTSCIPVVRDLIACGTRRVDRLFELLQVQWLDEAWMRSVDVNLDSLLNMNTPEDLEYVAERLRGL